MFKLIHSFSNPKQKVILFFAVFFCGHIYCQSNSGLVFYRPSDSVIIENYTFTPKASAVFNSEKFSLEKFVLSIGNQSETSTCTAFATAWAMRSIQYNCSRNITKTTVPKNGAGKFIFDPAFIYSTAIRNLAQRDDKINCNSGITFIDALTVLRDSGAIVLGDATFDPKKYNCYDKIKPIKYIEAKNNRIRDFKPTYLGATYFCSEIENNRPVGIGIVLPPNFKDEGDDFFLKKKKGKFYMQFPDNVGSVKSLEPHAMVIVGFDNKLREFKLLNSYGEKWGNEGYCYIKYTELFKLIKDDNSETFLPIHQAYILLEFTGPYKNLEKSTHYDQKEKYEYESFYNTNLPSGFSFIFRLVEETHNGAGNLKINCLSINSDKKSVVLSLQDYHKLTVLQQPELKVGESIIIKIDKREVKITVLDIFSDQKPTSISVVNLEFLYLK